jgi:hypothetical protein
MRWERLTPNLTEYTISGTHHSIWTDDNLVAMSVIVRDTLNRVEGLVWVLRDPILRWLAFIGFCCNFSMNTVWTMFLLHATHDLHLASSLIGLIFGMPSVGGLLGAIISRKVINSFPLGRVYLIARAGCVNCPPLPASRLRPPSRRRGPRTEVSASSELN